MWLRICLRRFGAHDLLWLPLSLLSSLLLMISACECYFLINNTKWHFIKSKVLLNYAFLKKESNLEYIISWLAMIWCTSRNKGMTSLELITEPGWSLEINSNKESIAGSSFFGWSGAMRIDGHRSDIKPIKRIKDALVQGTSGNIIIKMYFFVWRKGLLRSVTWQVYNVWSIIKWSF